MRDLTGQIFIELLRSYHEGIGVTHSAHPQVEVAGHLAKEASLMAAEFNAVTKGSVESGGDSEPFDIAKHEFGDTVGFVEVDVLELTLNCTGMNYIELYKGDAIAIAKALGVTAKDLS